VLHIIDYNSHLADRPTNILIYLNIYVRATIIILYYGCSPRHDDLDRQREFIKRFEKRRMKRWNHLRPRTRSGHNGVDRWGVLAQRSTTTTTTTRRENIYRRRAAAAAANTRCIPLPGSRYPGNGTVSNVSS